MNLIIIATIIVNHFCLKYITLNDLAFYFLFPSVFVVLVFVLCNCTLAVKFGRQINKYIIILLSDLNFSTPLSPGMASHCLTHLNLTELKEKLQPSVVTDFVLAHAVTHIT
jgi:hypothetical protein